MKKILVIGAAWVGDAVLSQPMLASLKAQHSDCQVDVYAPSWTHGVLQRMPEVDRVLDSPFPHGTLALTRRCRESRMLRSAGYEQAILLPNSIKSALIPWLARIPCRTGYRGEQRQWLLTDCRILDKSALPLMVERFAALAYPANTLLPRPVPAPRLQPDLTAQAKTLDRLHLSLFHPVCVLCPGAEYGPAKRWPVRHFQTLARHMAAQGFQIWLMGSPKDHAIAEEIAGALALDTPLSNLCGKTSLAEAVDLMALADRVITNDSGLMHVAAALDRPLAALFGSSSPAFTPPLSEQARVLSLALSCSPCFQRECPLGHLKCLEDLSPERVLEELNLLPSPPDSPRP